MKSVNLTLADYDVLVLYQYNKSIDYNYGATIDNTLGTRKEFIDVNIVDILDQDTLLPVNSSFAEIDLIKQEIIDMED